MKSFDKLKTKLAELFQLDQADLDFGIYRIMNARRDEILQFLDSDLLPQVQEAFKQYKSSDKAVIAKELEQLIDGIKKAGMDPDASPKVKELRTALEQEAVDIAAEEAQVYDHLYNFFSRYYDEGDFISLRRYKEGVYALPYEGEEVKLHWANHDQYYIKTTEYFRDYTFKTVDSKRVHFKIVEADTEKDNVKASNGNDRRFLLHGDQPVAEEDGDLVIRFEYRPDADKRKQDTINADTIQRVVADLNTKALAPWQPKLSAKAKRADGTEMDKTVLEKHLYDYTKRNTFDYFIHKDLGGFLRRELDFYIKNEVMRLDDIEDESAARVEQYLSKIKVIRRIAHKIIDFLAQIENFQKKLWLKKKFVIETNYCITLDRVPEELYPEIAANEAQREEWVRLFAIDEIEVDLAGAVEYSEPLTVEFLKTNSKLLLDTKFFPDSFRSELLCRLYDLSEQSNGILVHSENFQALQLMHRSFADRIGCIYVDPPYNTSASEIAYKNNYKHSSWMSLIRDRLFLGKLLQSPESIICVTIDDVEFKELYHLVERCYGEDNVLGVVPIRINPSGRPTERGFALVHEYAVFAGESKEATIRKMPRTKEQLKRFKGKDEKGVFEWRNLRREGSNSDRADGERQYYPIYANLSDGTIRVPAMEWNESKREWVVAEASIDGETTIWPVNESGREKNWRWSEENLRADYSQFQARVPKYGTPQVYYKYRPNMEGYTPLTLWTDSKYSATEHGTKPLKDLFNDTPFSYPKSIHAVSDCLSIMGLGSGNSLVLDYFAGSGTTAHATIELNRGDGGDRRYILVEMGEYFDSVMKPRVLKVSYSSRWNAGRPKSHDGITHMFKYIRLESYEDALTNIELKRTRQQELALAKSGDFRESYMLRYILDSEASTSQSLLNIEQFDDPFSYKLLIGTGSVGETKPVNVDLVETFNWLLGLKVRHMSWPKDYQLVEGDDPEGNKVLVIWRKIRDLAETDAEKIAAAREESNRDLDEFFRKQQYNTLDSEFDLIYVNGDNNLMNIPLEPAKEGVEPRYKVRLIDAEFKRLMFDVQDV